VLQQTVCRFSRVRAGMSEVRDREQLLAAVSYLPHMRCPSLIWDFPLLFTCFCESGSTQHWYLPLHYTTHRGEADWQRLAPIAITKETTRRSRTGITMGNPCVTPGLPLCRERMYTLYVFSCIHRVWLLAGRFGRCWQVDNYLYL
jgi:hypothetical protein